MNEEKRCPWCLSSPEMLRYHDEEWGARQCHDDRALFEFLTLEMMQCGLSWATVLAKRESMRTAFDNFEPAALAAYSEAQLAALLEAPGIIHSARKLSGMVRNARAFVRIQAREGSFDRWFWAFTKGQTVRYPAHSAAPAAKTALSERISAAFREEGFCFMGPVVVYSFLQAVGMVNDHAPDCFVFNRLSCTEIEDQDAFL